MKYLKSAKLNCKDIRIIKLLFLARTQLLWFLSFSMNLIISKFKLISLVISMNLITSRFKLISLGFSMNLITYRFELISVGFSMNLITSRFKLISLGFSMNLITSRFKLISLGFTWSIENLSKREIYQPKLQWFSDFLIPISL